MEAEFGPLERRIKNLTSLEIKRFKRTARYIPFDHRRNEEIMEEVKVESVDEKLRRYKSNRLQCVKRMNNNRIPKIMLNYRVNARIRLGRLSKILLDEAETGLLRPTS